MGPAIRAGFCVQADRSTSGTTSQVLPTDDEGNQTGRNRDLAKLRVRLPLCADLLGENSAEYAGENRVHVFKVIVEIEELFEFRDI